MLTTYGAALCFVLASVLTGQGVAWLIGRRVWWAPAPAVGLALLLCVAGLGSRLPERAVVSPVLLGLVLAVAGALAVRSGGRVSWPGLAGLAAAALALLASALPFYVNGRAGVLGVSLNNDTSAHLVWAEGLRSSTMAALYPLPEGYPLAPHALMAALASVTGIAMDEVLNGLLIAVGVLTALTALGLLARLPPVARAAGAALVAFAYLPAAYYGQGAFKETMMALFVLAFTAVLAEAHAPHAREPWLFAGVPAGLVAAGAVQVYSYLALGWFATVTVVWLAFELALGGREGAVSRARAALPALALPVGVGVAVLVVAVASQADRVLALLDLFSLSPATAEGAIAVSNLGNLVGRLSPYEVLGAWPSADFRFAPANAFHAGQLGVIALAAALAGAVVALRRREAAVVAGTAAALAVFWVADRGQSPYVAAKALVVAAPLVMTLALGALPVRPWRSRDRTGVARILLVAVFAVSAAYSTSLALRAAPVASDAAERELGALRHLLGSRPTLFLGSDNHVGWWLRDVRLGTPLAAAVGSPLPVTVRPEKPAAPGQPLDFDSVDAQTLDRFAYVITPRSDYDSEPPANFARVRAGALYELWERRGRTEARRTLEPPGAPGAPLDCRRRGRGAGTARVWPSPPRVANSGVPIPPGTSADLGLRLARGRWRLSLQYTSTTPVRILSRLGTFRLPANTAIPGPFFAFGELDMPAAGPVGFRVIAEQSARIGSRGAGANVGALAASAAGPEQDRPVERSCGRYLDWYRAP